MRHISTMTILSIIGGVKETSPWFSDSRSRNPSRGGADGSATALLRAGPGRAARPGALPTRSAASSAPRRYNRSFEAATGALRPDPHVRPRVNRRCISQLGGLVGAAEPAMPAGVAGAILPTAPICHAAHTRLAPASVRGQPLKTTSDRSQRLCNSQYNGAIYSGVAVGKSSGQHLVHQLRNDPLGEQPEPDLIR